MNAAMKAGRVARKQYQSLHYVPHLGSAIHLIFIIKT
jgi:hypothetical protein